MSGKIVNERGAVALITTMMFSVLIALLLTALIGLMVSEQRQQTDDEQALTAYYAAESGVEDALHQLVGLNGTLPGSIGNQCLTLASPNSSAKVSCEYITKSGTPAGTLAAADTPVEIDSLSGYNKVTFSWDTGSHPAGYYSFPACATGNSGCGASYNYAPPLEIAIAQYPTGVFAATSGAVQLKNALFAPHLGGSGSAAYGGLAGGNPIDANCTASGAVTYHCSATITGLTAADNYIFRLRSRFTGTNYTSAFSNNASTVSVPDGTYTIDVTAGSGASSRRVLYKVPYKQAALGGLDYVLYSDTDVCKDFDSLGGGGHSTSTCF